MNHRFGRWLFGLLALMLVSSALALNVSSANPLPPRSVAQPLTPASKVDHATLDDTANGKSAAFIVLLADQANVSAAYNIKDQDARGWYVYNTLKAKADSTQAPLISTLQAQGLRYQSFWVANAIVVFNGNRAVVDSLAARADVQAIEANRIYHMIEDPQIANYQPADQAAQPNTTEWGVQNVKAPQVWAMGYTGTNMVIGNADTGMQWDHPALKPHYRGWNGTTADHNYNWHDAIHDAAGNPCGNNSPFPCDDQGHGTHTTGTTSGDDGTGNQIGVAPGAKWIGCHNMDSGNGTPARYTECFQWFIAPTDLNGNNPNPTLRPDVINNSWGCPTSEGCAPLTLQAVVDNTQAAGIFVEASAGNSGSACGTVDAPPANYGSAFSTGAIDISNNLAGFSSRGPGIGTNLLKPNISAPGVNVRSSYPTNSYGSLSGTSMAGPHVVGVVALLWSARPWLARDITTTKNILQNTANPAVNTALQTCGGIPSSQIPNNSFGYGRVDALAALNSVPMLTPTPTWTPGGPTATPSNTATNTPTGTTTPTGTPTPCLGPELMVNGGFESGLSSWTIDGNNPSPVTSTLQVHSGTGSVLLGTVSGGEPTGDGALYQTVTVPAAGGTLSYWYYPGTTDTIAFDWQDAYVVSTTGTILATIMHVAENDVTWKNVTFNMTPYAGQTVRIKFLVHQDGFGDDTFMYVDDVSLRAPGTCGATNTPTSTPAVTATPTSTPICPTGIAGNHVLCTPTLPPTFTPSFTPQPSTFTATPTPTPLCPTGVAGNHVLCTPTLPPTNTPTFTPSFVTDTPTATPTGPTGTPTPTPCPANWYAAAPLPNPEMGAAVATLNGYIYAAGGTYGSTIRNTVLRYNGSGSWQPFASMPFSTTDSIAASDGTKLYVFGGYDSRGSATRHLQIYDPTTDTWSSGPDSPQGAAETSGVFAFGVMFVFGGCSDTACSTPLSLLQTYNPTNNVWGTGATIPNGGMARTAAAFNGLKNIYVAGGIDGTGLTTAKTWGYDPGDARWTDGGMTDLPEALSGASVAVLIDQPVLFGGVNGSGNISKKTLIYDPDLATWTYGPDLTIGSYRAGGAELNGDLYMVGGSTTTGNPTPTNRVERYAEVCSTSTPTITPTDCPNPFVDISGNTFYFAIHYLYCRGVVNGVDGTHFAPTGTATRAQFAKVVVLGFGIAPYTPSGPPDFTDVPANYFAFSYIEAGFHASILGGFTPAQCQAAGATYPCYLPNLAITRGQVTKLVVSAAHYALVTPVGGGQTYSDVPPSNVFYLYIETAHYKNVVNGFPDGTFRPNNNIQRDQMCQIVYKGVTTP